MPTIKQIWNFALGIEAKGNTTSGAPNKGTPSPAKPPAGKTPAPTSGGRKSAPPSDTGAIVSNLSKEYRVVNRGFLKEIIPLMRKLMMANLDISQAIHNIVSLGNTGHKVTFDPNVSAEQVDKMRRHLKNKQTDWASGQAGMDGLVNKFFAQILVSGALSNEWVPNLQLTSLDSVVLVNPEEIDFILSSNKTKYEPYQRPRMGLIDNNSDILGLIRLNTDTYRYYALNGDTEIPYGFPPYMSVLPRVSTQQKMLDNIDFVIDQMGLTGFLEALITKPEQGSLTDAEYDIELDSLLATAKNNLASGMKDGIVVGYDGDHKFKFNTFTKAYADALELFNNNETLISSGLKMDSTLLGRSYSTSETQITVVFIKMLSELKNIQNIIKTNLEFGYALELRLAGFNFEYLSVTFNRSTLQDDLKYQQAEEYKIKNVQSKMFLGIINQDQAADELGYETPAFDAPVVPLEVLAGVKTPADDPTAKKARKVDKNASAKKTKEKSKPVTKDK